MPPLSRMQLWSPANPAGAVRLRRCALCRHATRTGKRVLLAEQVLALLAGAARGRSQALLAAVHGAFRRLFFGRHGSSQTVKGLAGGQPLSTPQKSACEAPTVSQRHGWRKLSPPAVERERPSRRKRAGGGEASGVAQPPRKVSSPPAGQGRPPALRAHAGACVLAIQTAWALPRGQIPRCSALSTKSARATEPGGARLSLGTVRPTTRCARGRPARSLRLCARLLDRARLKRWCLSGCPAAARGATTAVGHTVVHDEVRTVR